MAKRRKNKKRSIPVIILIIMLALGLLGSAVVGLVAGLSNLNTPSGGTVATQNFDQEIDALKQQVKAAPNDPAIKMNLGHKYFEKALDLQRNNDPKATESFNLAISEYEKIKDQIKNANDVKGILGNLATAYFYTEKTADAIKTVKKTLELDPAFPAALLNYGIYLAYGQGNYTEAITQLKKVQKPRASEDEYQKAQSLIKEFEAKKAKASTPAPSTTAPATK